MSKGVQFGLMYLNEGFYEIRGGYGNKVLSEFEVKDGMIYTRDSNEGIIPPSIEEFKSIK